MILKVYKLIYAPDFKISKLYSNIAQYIGNHGICLLKNAVLYYIQVMLGRMKSFLNIQKSILFDRLLPKDPDPFMDRPFFH